jgi:hypothetical protein
MVCIGTVESRPSFETEKRIFRDKIKLIENGAGRRAEEADEKING